MGDRKVNSLYTHRTDVLFFDSNETLVNIKMKVSGDKHAAYPVCENGDLNKVNGVGLIKDLFTAEENNFQLKNYLRNPVYVNKSMLAYKVVELFKQEGIHFGIVIDEFGGVEGVVTMDDIVDALIGDHTEQHQDEYSITKRDSNSWLVDGQYSIIEFFKHFDIDSEEGYETHYTTVAGFLIHSAETLPQVGFTLEAHGLKFEVIDKDGQRIDKVLVTKL